MISEFITKAKEKMDFLSEKKLEKAYAFAKKEAGGHVRQNGDPYITHTIAIAEILIELRVDESTLLSAFLFDSLLRRPESITEIEKEFGKEVAQIATGVAKLTEIQLQHSLGQSEAIRNMFLTIAKDSRVAIIRLADRLHNMQTLDVLPQEKQITYAKETLSVCAPIASRLGIFALKGPLEDLSFSYLSPEECAHIQKQMHRHEKYRTNIIHHAQEKIKDIMSRNNIIGHVSGRVKHTYSIYKKLNKKGKDSVDDIYDIFAMRILVPSVTDCYSMLGFIHEKYTPLQGRFKDYIAVPKPNGYQSLHTTVMGLSPFTDKVFPIEIQIRTEEMNSHAEYGMSAHWHYKEKGSKRLAQTKHTPNFKKEIENIAENIEEQKKAASQASIEELSDRIYALTPRGDIKILPQGATPIDFAFSVHGDIGLHLRLAKANGKLVPLDYKIQSGDIMEIMTSKDAKPSYNWLSICISNKTKQKIKAYFQKKDVVASIRQGRELLNKHLKNLGCEELDQNLLDLKEYGSKTKNKREREEILLRIGNGSINPGVVARDIAERQGKKVAAEVLPKKDAPALVKKEEEIEVIIGENRDIPVRTASCCKAKPGDKIIGFVTRGNHVTIHKITCNALKKLDARRFIEARYENEEPTFLLSIRVTRNFDRTGFAHDILTIFRAYNINLNQMDFEGSGPFQRVMIFGAEVQDKSIVEKLTKEIQKVENVIKVKVEVGL